MRACVRIKTTGFFNVLGTHVRIATLFLLLLVLDMPRRELPASLSIKSNIVKTGAAGQLFNDGWSFVCLTEYCHFMHYNALV